MLRAKRKATHRAHPEPSRGNPLHGYRQDFLEWSRAVGLSARTVEGRGYLLTYFIRWCDERGLTRVCDFTLPVLERYQRHLYHYRTTFGKPLSCASQHKRLIVLKAFFRWAVRQRLILTNPASDLQMARLPQRLPHTVLTVAEMESILAQPDTDSAPGLRDRAILELLYSTGLRRMELMNLKLPDIDLKRGVLRVREGKGRRDRVTPVGARAAAWMERYLNEVRGQLLGAQDDGYVFLTDYGEPLKDNRLARLVKGALRAAGLNVPGACHLFRHAAATHMLENGADIRYIQAFLGHTKLDTTQIYTHVSIRKLQEIHAATHPARLHADAGRSNDAAPTQTSTDAKESLLAALNAEAMEHDKEPA